METTAVFAAAASANGSNTFGSAAGGDEQSNDRALVPSTGSVSASVHSPRSGLTRALEVIPQEVARMLLQRAFMLRQASRAMKRAVESVGPAVQIKVKHGTTIAQIAGGVVELQIWCVLAALDLSPPSFCRSRLRSCSWFMV